jgi:hypothetical protein
MRPVWLIKAGDYGAEAEPLLAGVRRQGMAAEVVPFRAMLTVRDSAAGPLGSRRNRPRVRELSTSPHQAPAMPDGQGRRTPGG